MAAADLRVAWLGHSTVVLDLGGVRLVTDPLLRRHNGPLRRRGPAPARHSWAGADAVLLSHLHHDHAELASLRMLAGVPVVTGAANADWLRRHRLAGVDPGDSWYDVGDGVAVRLVHAVHHSRPMPHRPNGANGHLVRAAGATVWIAGDTDLYVDMADIPALAGRDDGIDLAVVPVAGWGPRLSEGHMGPGEAAAACALTRARWTLPVHWGTLHPPLMHRFGDWMDRPLPAFRAALAAAAPACRLVLAAPGTWTALTDGGGRPA